MSRLPAVLLVELELFDETPRFVDLDAFGAVLFLLTTKPFLTIIESSAIARTRVLRFFSALRSALDLSLLIYTLGYLKDLASLYLFAMTLLFSSKLMQVATTTPGYFFDLVGIRFAVAILVSGRPQVLRQHIFNFFFHKFIF